MHCRETCKEYVIAYRILSNFDALVFFAPCSLNFFVGPIEKVIVNLKNFDKDVSIDSMLSLRHVRRFCG